MSVSTHARRQARKAVTPQVTDPNALYTILALNALQIGDQMWWVTIEQDGITRSERHGPWKTVDKDDLETAYRCFRDRKPLKHALVGWSRP